MKLDIIISADNINEKYLENKIVVVIDMLRATSVITTALNNGCNKVVPFLTVEEAFDYRKNNVEPCLLGGERRALKIEGFDFSNSPLEYTSDKVKNKIVVITTTNGTRAIQGASKANRIFIGSMLNAKAVTEALKTLDKDVVFVNAGTYGEFSMDDFICAGYMISLLSTNKENALSDIAFTAKYIYENNKDIVSFIKNARHFSVLKSLQLEEDLTYCTKKDIISIVPEFKDGEIKIASF
ncbi:2-phosphosulfolactate phosphatase [Clostridium amylolyticum]|uniref:Probable 2-phosphosulfolactate phosphatase n=1 Tax=Clostridium amylolyticum TaxID=1121298 RepID=A0A1M6EMP3_9CLOT|nr:2-phosphosulfolactate phosphatase family protein [Clostridium amylolyticum]SHI86771.1 2-phosphosulfolactate phosphatase [Clostridium amylolyticum]